MFRIGEKQIGKRVDTFLSEYLKQEGYSMLSRSFLKDNWDGIVSINGTFSKPSYKLRQGDEVEVDLKKAEDLVSQMGGSEKIIGQKGKLDIVFENEEVLVVNKAKGMVVHPSFVNRKNTLANMVRGYLEGKGEFDKKVNRAGIVHRLDKGVSGLIVFAKTVEMQKYLQKQFEEHKVWKLYLAKVDSSKASPEILPFFPKSKINVKNEVDKLVKNQFEVEDNWFKAEGYIARSFRNRVKMEFKKYGKGKYALSYIKPVSLDEMLILIHTGRMHQIRATLAYLGLYIHDDTLYGLGGGNNMPKEIELKSILIGFKDMDGKRILVTKY